MEELKILQEDQQKLEQQQHMLTQQHALCQEKIQKQQQALYLQLEARMERICQTWKQIALRCTVENGNNTSSTAQKGMAHDTVGDAI